MRMIEVEVGGGVNIYKVDVEVEGEEVEMEEGRALMLSQ